MRSTNILAEVLLLCLIFPVCNAVLTCLSCPDSPLPRVCPHVINCGPHEVCYASSVVTTVGTVQYELGCRDVKQCIGTSRKRDANGMLVCSECCNGTLCNSGLCGQQAIPPLSPEVRGPICYACDQQLDPGSCHVIKECGRDEECMLKRFTSQVGHHLIYQTDCVKKTVCAEEMKRLQQADLFGSLLGRRQTDRNDCWMKCCGQDLCNSNCSGSRVVPFSVSTTTQTIRLSSADVVTTLPPSTPVETHTVSISAPCYDKKYDCNNYLTYCTDPQYEDWMHHNCRKSCNMCDDTCFDKGVCTTHLQYCSTQKEWAFQNCRKSCGLCNEVLSVSPTRDPACNLPDQYDATYCQQYAQYCNDARYNTRIVCRHFCGHCF